MFYIETTDIRIIGINELEKQLNYIDKNINVFLQDENIKIEHLVTTEKLLFIFYKQKRKDFPKSPPVPKYEGSPIFEKPKTQPPKQQKTEPSQPPTKIGKKRK